MGLEKKISHVNYLIDTGDFHEALRTFSRSRSCYRVDKFFVEKFIDGLALTASHRFEQHIFNNNIFLCYCCSKIIKYPVTLKCGHSFSKQCIVDKAALYPCSVFVCPRCDKTHTLASLASLSRNSTMLYIVDKLSLKLKLYKEEKDEADRNKEHEAQKFIRSCRKMCSKVYFLNSFHETTSLGFYKKGYILFRCGRYEQAFKALLTSLTLDYEFHSAKHIAIKVFKRLLQKQNANINLKEVITSGSNSSLHEDDVFSSDEEDSTVFKGLFQKQTANINLRLSGSNNSLHEDDIFSSDEEDSTVVEYPDREDLHQLIEIFFDDIEKLKLQENLIFKIDVESYLEKKEFECPLCSRIFWEPVTTNCGHTFCKRCISNLYHHHQRCVCNFDHQQRCPLCNSSLALFFVECGPNFCTTEFLELAIRNLFPTEYAEREAREMAFYYF